jgi:hypothetical protein
LAFAALLPAVTSAPRIEHSRGRRGGWLAVVMQPLASSIGVIWLWGRNAQVAFLRLVRARLCERLSFDVGCRSTAGSPSQQSIGGQLVTPTNISDLNAAIAGLRTDEQKLKAAAVAKKKAVASLAEAIPLVGQDGYDAYRQKAKDVVAIFADATGVVIADASIEPIVTWRGPACLRISFCSPMARGTKAVSCRTRAAQTSTSCIARFGPVLTRSFTPSRLMALLTMMDHWLKGVGGEIPISGRSSNGGFWSRKVENTLSFKGG